MKRIIITLTIIAVSLMTGCVQASAQQGVDTFSNVSDKAELRVESAIAYAERLRAEEAEAAEQECTEYCEEASYEPASYGEWNSVDGFYKNGERQGVDSATETWYPESAGRHFRTDEWHMDDEGYYRTAEGYYVVASNDYPEGTVINTSKGEAQVLDDGTYSGNVDFYVGW